MPTTNKILVSVVALLLIFQIAGCTETVRQTFVPYLTTGLHSIADGLIEALESELYPENNSSSSSSSSSS